MVVRVDLERRETLATIQEALRFVEQMKVFAYREYHSGYALLYVREPFAGEVIEQLSRGGFSAIAVE